MISEFNESLWDHGGGSNESVQVRGSAESAAITSNAKVRAVSQPRSYFVLERTQETLSLARVCLSELPISGGKAAGNGSSGGTATATNDRHGFESEWSIEQDSQIGNAAEPKEDLPEALAQFATVHTGQGCFKR